MKHKRLSALLAAGMMLSALPALPALPAAAASKLLGDVTADGTVTVADGVALSRFVAKWSDITIDKDAADLNQDGEITKEDATILVRYLAGWDGYDKYIVPIEVADPNTLRIETQPVSTAIDYGEKGSLTVKAAGGTEPYTYQWMLEGEDITGAESATYAPTTSGKYRCVVTDSKGAAVLTNTATFAIHPIITQQPVSYAPSQTVTVAGGKDLTYAWQKKVGSDDWQTVISSKTNTVSDLTYGTFRCKITDFDGYELFSDTFDMWPGGKLAVGQITYSVPQDETVKAVFVYPNYATYLDAGTYVDGSGIYADNEYPIYKGEADTLCMAAGHYVDFHVDVTGGE